MPGEALGSCLGLGTLGQRKLYKKMEGAAFVYRSMYHDHLQHWLKFLTPAQLLVLPSEALFDQQTIQPAMARLARFLSLPAEARRCTTSCSSRRPRRAPPGRRTRTGASTSRTRRATWRRRSLSSARNRMLAELLSRHKLTAGGGIAWLPRALAGAREGERGAVTWRSRG